jgi:PAS domain S-box-containing protein
MAILTRNFDWNQTPIGRIEQWPDILLTTVNTLLATRQPMFLWWGRELIQFYNDAYRPSIGADKHPKALGQRGAECWPEIWPIIGPQIDAVMRHGESSWHEDQLVPIYRNGKLEDVYWTYGYSPVRDAKGVIRGTLVTCSETTRRVMSDEALRSSEARQALILNLLQSQRETTDPEAIMRSAAEAVGRYLKVDRTGFLKISGDSLKFLEGWSAGRLPLLTNDFPVESMGTKYLVEVRSGKTLGIDDARIDPLTAGSRFGEIGTISLIGAPIIRNAHWHAGFYVTHSEVRHWKDDEIALVRDVAEQSWDAVERARAEAAHDAVAEQLQQVLEATTDAIISVDRSWQITYLNQRAQEILAPTGNILGTNHWESLPATIYGGSPYVEHYYRAMNEREAGEFEAYYPEPLNIWTHVMVRPARDGIVLFLRDITEQKRATAALIQAEKLAAVGRLASSIAHEINNPLTAVTNLLYLSTIGEASPDVKRYLALAEQELSRVTNIATQTLRFHRQSTKARPASLREILESVVTLFQGRIRNTEMMVERQYRTERQITVFDGDLRQVFVNMIGNALDSTQHGGQISLRVREGIDWESGKAGIIVLVADTGHGMSKKTSRLIFEPFFTTKGSMGTGLGLWVSAEVLRNHKAKVRVRSSEDPNRHGTVFSIFFPLDGTETTSRLATERQ